MKDQIHHQLNDFDAYQKRYEQQQQQQFYSNPFFVMSTPVPRRRSPQLEDETSSKTNSVPTADALQREIEEFFEAAGFPGWAEHQQRQQSNRLMSQSSMMSSTSRISGIGGQYHYQVMQQENEKGVQIDVQFPRGGESSETAENPTHVNAIQVTVVEDDHHQQQQQERHPIRDNDPFYNYGLRRVPPFSSSSSSSSSSCLVQWRDEESKIHDQTRLGSHIDCSQLSASISMSQNRLTMKAPRRRNVMSEVVSTSSQSSRQEKDLTTNSPPSSRRLIPVIDKKDQP